MTGRVFEGAAEFMSLCPTGALAGLDLGTKTVGLAVSDPLRTVATALQTLPRTKFSKDVVALNTHLDARDVRGFVLGLPLNMDGTSGPRAQSARGYAHNLAKTTDRDVILWDERLSTVAAERSLLEADASRKRRSEVIDSVAAAIILQSFLDRLAHIAGTS